MNVFAEVILKPSFKRGEADETVNKTSDERITAESSCAKQTKH